MAKERLNEAILLAEHVKKIKGLKTDTRKTEALWLITSESTARGLDFDTGVVKPGVPAPIAVVLEEKNCDKTLRRALEGRRLDEGQAADGLGWIRNPSRHCFRSRRKEDGASDGKNRGDAQENKKLQIAIEDLMGGGDGRLPLESDKGKEVLQGPFKEELLETMQGFGFQLQSAEDSS